MLSIWRASIESVSHTLGVQVDTLCIRGEEEKAGSRGYIYRRLRIGWCL